MKWRLFTVGKPALTYARLGSEEYLKRVRRYTACEHHILRQGSPEEIGSRMDAEGKAGVRHILLDERGERLDSRAFAGRVSNWQIEAVKTVQVFIGGADGFSRESRKEADEIWQLSALTLQHELALVVFLEQLYRAHTLLRGEPYHR